jgi:hypothetical protein
MQIHQISAMWRIWRVDEGRSEFMLRSLDKLMTYATILRSLELYQVMRRIILQGQQVCETIASDRSLSQLDLLPAWMTTAIIIITRNIIEQYWLVIR